jgi:hypothetical protein
MDEHFKTQPGRADTGKRGIQEALGFLGLGLRGRRLSVAKYQVLLILYIFIGIGHKCL